MDQATSNFEQSKASKSEQNRFKQTDPVLYAEFEKVWSVRERHMVTGVLSLYVVAVIVLTVATPCVKQESQSSCHNGILMDQTSIFFLCQHQNLLVPGVAQTALNVTKPAVMATT